MTSFLGQALLAAGDAGKPMNVGEGLGFGPGFALTVWTFVTFGVVLVVLWKFAWTPMLAALDARSAKIRGDIDSAEKTRTDAEKLKAEYQVHLDRARDEVKEIVEEGKRDGKKVREEIIAEAKGEADKIRARARRETELAEAQALQEVWDTATDLATELAAKIIEKSLTPSDQRRLAEEVIARYKATLAGGRGRS